MLNFGLLVDFTFYFVSVIVIIWFFGIVFTLFALVLVAFWFVGRVFTLFCCNDCYILVCW